MRSPLHDLEFVAVAPVLAALDGLGVPELEVLHRLELTAADLYVEIAERLDNAGIAEVLRRNAREEIGHARRVRRAISKKAGAGYRPPSYLDERYDVVLPPVDSRMLVALVEGERAGDADYQRWAANEADPEVAQLLRRSGDDEAKHAARLEEVLGLA